MAFVKRTTLAVALGTTALVSALGGAVSADIQQLDDVIITQSLCVGQDCVNGENFGFDTIRMKENNLRIKAQDTSNSASFPSMDWQLTFNDSSNGGANKFSIDSIDNGATPFTIEGGAPSNSLYVDDGGRIGIGEATPVVELHVADGDSPTVRLEQDGSSGFTPQTWDMAGNETNFFIRDATNGSKLPFKIKPAAPTNSLFVNTNGDIGLQTASPGARLHVVGDNVLIEGADSNVAPVERLEVRDGNLRLSQAGAVNVTFSDSSHPGNDVRVQHSLGNLNFSFIGSGEIEMSLSDAGNLTLHGGLISMGGGGACTAADPCDRVFDTSVYQVPSIEDHAREMWAKQHLPAVGPTGPDQPLNVTLKLVRMLNELEHAHIYIEQLNTELTQSRADMAQVLTRLEQLEQNAKN